MNSRDTHAHRRLNPLTGDYVLVSPHRAQRPWQGKVESVESPPRDTYDAACYLCPGNERAGGDRNPSYRETFVFDNDFGALQAEPAHAAQLSPEPAEGDTGLRFATPEYGRCRVVCFSPRHDLTLAELTETEIEGVIRTWTEETEVLAADPEISYVQIFENKGEVMGCSNPHPHGQIWAQSSLPTEVVRENERQRAYFEQHGRPMLADYVAAEMRDRERVICANDDFAVVVPFWATWPFETLILPLADARSLSELSGTRQRSMASILSQLTRTYDRLFDSSFPYSAGIHQSPVDGRDYPWFTLHMHFYPPLLRSATVKKFMVGYEMLGEAQRDLTPEAAAVRLREYLAP